MYGGGYLTEVLYQVPRTLKGILYLFLEHNLKIAWEKNKFGVQ